MRLGIRRLIGQLCAWLLLFVHNERAGTKTEDANDACGGSQRPTFEIYEVRCRQCTNCGRWTYKAYGPPDKVTGREIEAFSFGSDDPCCGNPQGKWLPDGYVYM